MGVLNQSKIQNTNYKNLIQYVHPYIQKHLIKRRTWKDTCGPQKIPLFQLPKNQETKRNPKNKTPDNPKTVAIVQNYALFSTF